MIDKVTSRIKSFSTHRKRLLSPTARWYTRMALLQGTLDVNSTRSIRLSQDAMARERIETELDLQIKKNRVFTDVLKNIEERYKILINTLKKDRESFLDEIQTLHQRTRILEEDLEKKDEINHDLSAGLVESNKIKKALLTRHQNELEDFRAEKISFQQAQKELENELQILNEISSNKVPYPDQNSL